MAAPASLVGTALAIGAAAALASACSAPDPGLVIPRSRDGGVASDGGTSAGTDDGGDTSGGGADGGAAGDGGTSKPNAFTGAPAFTAMTGPTTVKPGHTSAGFPGGNPAGKNCLDCHTGNPVAFSIGGTVMSGTGPAKSVEVRVRAPDGAAFSAYTDDLGNFFVKKSDHALPANANVGVRSAAKALPMDGALGASQGGCNQAGSCHGGTQKAIHLP